MIKMNKNKKNPEEIPISKEDEIFKLLTHQTRRNIIKILGEHNLTFSQIKRDLDIDSPTLSYHLKSMNQFIIQKKSKYNLSDIGRAALFLLTKADQSIKMSRYKMNFFYAYIITYASWVIAAVLVPITIVYIASIDLSVWVLEIAINVIAVINMSVIGILKSRYT